MKRFFAAALLCNLALADSASAALVVHVEDVIVNTSLVGPTTGFIEVYLEETGGTNEVVSAYNVGVRLLPTGVVTFTGSSASVTHPSLFLGQSPTDRTANAAGYNAANDRLLTDDFVVSGNSADAPIQNGTRDGMFRLAFNIPQGALGVFAVNLDPNETFLSRADASDIDGFVLDGGSITVIPEPAALSFVGAAGLALAVRRRRPRARDGPRIHSLACDAPALLRARS
jgi:hypothetical protein